MTSFPLRAQHLSAAGTSGSETTGTGVADSRMVDSKTVDPRTAESGMTDSGMVEEARPARRRGPRSLSCAVLLVSTLVLASCGSDSDAEGQSEEDSGGGIPQPEYDDDETTRLPLAFVSPHGSEEGAPSGENGNMENPDAPGAQEEDETEADDDEPLEAVHVSEMARSADFGCGDTVSVVRSEPLVTDEPARDAVDFLLDDERYYHGDPAFINALAASEQQLSIESIEVEEDSAVVELSGEPITRSDCESWQIIVQLQVTARAATGADSAEILLDGSPLAEELGLPADDVPQVELLDVED